MAETQSAPSLREGEIVTLIAKVWLTEHGVSDEVAADLSDPEEFPHVAAEDWAACAAIAKRIVGRHQATLTEAVAAARAEGWQPIETAPRDGTDILIAGGCFDYTGYTFPNPQPIKGCKISSWQKDCWWMEYGDEFDEYYFALPTYWQPLPAPPTTPGGRTDG